MPGGRRGRPARLAALLLQDADCVLGGVADLLDEGRHREELGHTSPCEYRGEAPDGGQGHQRHEKQRHHLPADRLPAKVHGLPQLKPPAVEGAHLCVNNWARAYYRRTSNSKSHPESELPHRWPDMGSCCLLYTSALREIASREHATAHGKDPAGLAGQLAGNSSFAGIFRTPRSSFFLGNGGGLGHRSRMAPPGGVKQRKPGNRWGAESSDAGERSAGGGE